MAFNPQRSFRTPTFRSQLSVRRVYETLQPRSEMKETPEAYLLHVYLVGFTKDQIKIELLDKSKKVRITGERPIPVNKWRKFDQTYPVPENSEAETLEAKFEQGTLILKMRKKPISKSQEGEKSASNNKANLDETKVEKTQETNNIPQSQSTKDMKMKSDSPQTQFPQDKISNNDTQKGHPQKGQQEFETKTISKDKPTNQIDENPQKGHEEFEPKKTYLEKIKIQLDENTQKGQEEFEPKKPYLEKTKLQIDENPQKGQDEIESNTTSLEKSKTHIDEKGQEEFESKRTSLETTTTQTNEEGQAQFESKPKEKMVTNENLEETIVAKSGEDEEKENISKKEFEEKNDEKTYESSKTMKDVKYQNLEEKENEKTEHSTPEVTENEKESCCRVSPNQEGKNEIRNFVVASSKFVTRIAEGKWSDEERQLVENVGAAVLVIAAFGAYVSYRFSS